jgi:hypothetical protein
MNKTNEQVAEEAVVRVLRATHANDAATAPARHRQQTSQCPHVSRFAAVLKFHDQWTSEEFAHLQSGCPFCKRVQHMFAAALAEAAKEDTVVNLSKSGSEETVLGLSPRKPAKPDAPGDAPKPG